MRSRSASKRWGSLPERLEMYSEMALLFGHLDKEGYMLQQKANFVSSLFFGQTTELTNGKVLKKEY